MKLPSIPRRPRVDEFTIRTTLNVPPVSFVPYYIDHCCLLVDVEWHLKYVRQWPYFWRVKNVWEVSYTFKPETEAQRRARLVVAGVQ